VPLYEQDKLVIVVVMVAHELTILLEIGMVDDFLSEE
jgi:hypothetical protein